MGGTPFSLVAPGWPGVVGQSGGVAHFSAEAKQWLDRLVPAATSARAAIDAAYIDGLVADGVWPKLDFLRVDAAANAATSLQNMKSASFLSTLNTSGGIPTFTADFGWATNSGTIDTNFNPSIAGGVYTQNDALVACWNLSTTKTDQQLLGNAGASSVGLYPCNASDGKTDWRINGGSDTHSVAFASDPSGFWIMQRTASNAEAVYHNNTDSATSAVASTALVNSDLLGPMGSLYQIALLAFGASLTIAQRTAFFTRSQTRLRAVGLSV